MDHPVFLARSPTPSQLFSPRVTLSESRVVTQPWQQQPPAVATSAMQQQQVSMTLDMGCNNLLQIWHWWSNWMFKRKLKYYLWYKILMDQPKRGSWVAHGPLNNNWLYPIPRHPPPSRPRHSHLQWEPPQPRCRWGRRTCINWSHVVSHGYQLPGHIVGWGGAGDHAVHLLVQQEVILLREQQSGMPDIFTIVFGSISSKCEVLQGDTSDCLKPPVDIKTKVSSQYTERSGLLFTRFWR